MVCSAFAAAAVPLPDRPEFDHAFAGLLMLADWLGSDTQFFPFANGADPDRMLLSRRAADVAMRAVGLAVEDRRKSVKICRPDFAALFAVPTPRPIQQHATMPSARCVVLEAETGSGKTEAALWRFVHLFTEGAVDGLYFALPTRVAATQMFGRIKKLRDALFPEGDRPAVVLAVPGQVGADNARGHSLPEFGFEWDDVPTDQQRAERWAAEHPKRFLAAQIAVGTIDQVLLASIATRHAHLRGTALLRHLLVVDEVHASDRFMEALLTNLLRSHLQAGGHAMLLSATLGAGAQARLLGTKQRSLAEAEGLAYPAYGWAEAGDAKVLPIDQTTTGKTVWIAAEPWLNAPERIAVMARAAADAGAKVLVIRNTVGAAIATARATEALGCDAALFRIGDVATLHHGRFSASDRLLLDAETEKVLGKDSPPAARIVVGDADFGSVPRFGCRPADHRSLPYGCASATYRPIAPPRWARAASWIRNPPYGGSDTRQARSAGVAARREWAARLRAGLCRCPDHRGDVAADRDMVGVGDSSHEPAAGRAGDASASAGGNRDGVADTRSGLAGGVG